MSVYLGDKLISRAKLNSNDKLYIDDESTGLIKTWSSKKVDSLFINSWSLLGEFTGSTSITLPSGFNEVQIICTFNTSSDSSAWASETYGKKTLSDMYSAGAKIVMMVPTSSVYYKYVFNITGENNFIFSKLYQYNTKTFTDDEITSYNNNYIRMKVYYR